MLRWLIDVLGITDQIRQEHGKQISERILDLSYWCYDPDRPDATVVLSVLADDIDTQNGRSFSVETVRKRFVDWKGKDELTILKKICEKEA